MAGNVGEGIYPRGAKGIYWMQFRYNGHRIHESTGTAMKAEALKIMMKKKYSLMEQEEQVFAGPVHDGDMTFRAAGIKVFGIHFKDQRSSYVVSTQQGVLNQMIGDLMVSSIDASVFSTVETKLRNRGCSPNTINKYFNTINVTLELARKKFSAPCSPVPKVRLKIKKTSIRCISKTEEEKILKYMRTPKTVKHARTGWTNRDLIEIYTIGISTGMRRGELFSFRVEQVNGQTIRLTPDQHKTGDTQGDKTIILSEEARDLIKVRIERLKLKPGDKVFAYSLAAYTRLWDRMKEEIGLPADERLSPHCMRHTFASRMAEKGMSIYHVSKMLGHTTVKTTEMYAHLFKDELVEAMNRFSMSGMGGQESSPPVTNVPPVITEAAIVDPHI